MKKTTLLFIIFCFYFSFLFADADLFLQTENSPFSRLESWVNNLIETINNLMLFVSIIFIVLIFIYLVNMLVVRDSNSWVKVFINKYILKVILATFVVLIILFIVRYALNSNVSSFIKI